MTTPQPDSRERPLAPRSRAAFVGFLLGVPLAVGLLMLVLEGPLKGTLAERYLSHPVEQAELVLFCIAVFVLLAKGCGALSQRFLHRSEPLPPWDGKPVPVSEASELARGLRRLGRRVQQTWLVRRVLSILDFVASRRSANELDDQLRSLADNDALAQENSYALLRFITWAVPILGFLGTVVGITDAVANVTPDTLEQSLNQVTGGLALAFDTTALALVLTMILMFGTYLVERLEQSALERVDRYADEQLAHRFERIGTEGGEFVATVRHGTEALLQATGQLVERQAELWARSLTAAEQRWAEEGQRQQQRLAEALGAALERTLEAHQRRLDQVEQQALDRHAALAERLGALATTLRETAGEQQEGLAQVARGIAEQAAALAKLQEGEGQLVRLQEALQRNLDALAGAGAFEEAVHALTAAIHLLTARAGALSARPGAAA